MPRIPTEVSALLQQLKTRLPVILGRNLVGIYLYGSLTQGAFNPKRSDVDCIVVTKRALSEAHFRKLSAWLARAREANVWVSRLQMTLLIRNEVLTMNSQGCLYQFGQLTRSGSDGNPIIWLNVLKSGVILHGARPETFVPTITPAILFRALEREVGYLRKEMSSKPARSKPGAGAFGGKRDAETDWRNVPAYRVYAVLTLCRILYSFTRGAIVSKRRAARWAIKHLPPEWRAIIVQALANEARDDTGQRPRISLHGLKRFIDFADTQLHSAPRQPGRSRQQTAR